MYGRQISWHPYYQWWRIVCYVGSWNCVRSRGVGHWVPVVSWCLPVPTWQLPACSQCRHAVTSRRLAGPADAVSGSWMCRSADVDEDGQSSPSVDARHWWRDAWCRTGSRMFHRKYPPIHSDVTFDLVAISICLIVSQSSTLVSTSGSAVTICAAGSYCSSCRSMFLNFTTGGGNMKTVSVLKEIMGEGRRAWRGEGNTKRSWMVS